MCSPTPLRRRGPRRPPPKPPPTRLARAKPALEISAHYKILETTIRSPVTPTPARRSLRCARPCRFVGGGPDGPLRNLPQHGWRGQSPRSKPASTPRSSRRRFAPLSRPLPPVDHHDVLAHAASSEGAQTAPSETSPNTAGAGKARARNQRALKILETTIRSPVTPTLARRSL